MVTNFDSNPRRKQELRMRPVADQLYYRVFGKDVNITRYERGEKTMLDLHFAIDVEIEFHNGLILTGQEKFLSPEFAHYHSITVEYKQNDSELGDWFKLAAQFYTVGYATKGWDSFDPWAIVYWPMIVVATADKRITWHDNENKDGHAQATFRYCDMLLLPPECIISGSWSKLIKTEYEVPMRGTDERPFNA